MTNHFQEKEQKTAPPSGVQPTQPSTGSGDKPAADPKEQREVLKKNVTEGQSHRHPDTPAGQHATGSFTGENDAKK